MKDGIYLWLLIITLELGCILLGLFLIGFCVLKVIKII